ncbi:MAG: pilus assembly protein PilM [Planctomycetes bacterium]|jgi:type IV pilus assembly protein PilM|nr:pilus assembly protein PilM [Planctomycetota bacterium]
MFKSLFQNRTWPIALDIGGDSIKLLQMRQAGSVLKVHACARWRFSESDGVDPLRRRQQAVSVIPELLRSNGFVGRKVITSLSCEDLCIKSIRMAAMPDAQMHAEIMREAASRFGFEIARDQIAWLNAGQVRQGAEVRNEIILLAVKPQVIADHLSLLSSVGLKPQHIDAEPIALFRAFERMLRRKADEQAVTVVVDIGSRSTRVIVARGREVVFIKNIDAGGRRFTQTLARHLNIPHAEAEELRLRLRRPSEKGDESSGRGSVDWTLYDALRAEVEGLGREIALCLRYCAVTFRGLRPTNVLLTGGESYDRAVVELLGEHLGVPCVVAQPFKGIDVASVDFGADRRATLSEWTLCLGLAGRFKNLSDPVQENGDATHRLSA